MAALLTRLYCAGLYGCQRPENDETCRANKRTACLHVYTWRHMSPIRCPTCKLPEIWPGEFQCKLKVVLLLVLDPADAPDQPLGFSLRLLLELAPVRHDGVGFNPAVILTLGDLHAAGWLRMGLEAVLDAALASRKWRTADTVRGEGLHSLLRDRAGLVSDSSHLRMRSFTGSFKIDINWFLFWAERHKHRFVAALLFSEQRQDQLADGDSNIAKDFFF